jgi:uncharacterized protein YjbJ (UPF0337 family)
MVKLHTPIWRMIQYHVNYLLTLICGGTVHALFDMEQKRICLCSSRRSFIAMTDSSTRDRAEGMFDQGKGNVKKGVGDLTGNERMKGEGEMDELKGKGEQAWGDIKDAAGDLKDDAGRMKDDIDRKTR